MLADFANILILVAFLTNLGHWLATGRLGSLFVGALKASSRLAQIVTVGFLTNTALFLLKLIPADWFVFIGCTLAAVVNMANIHQRRKALRPQPPS